MTGMFTFILSALKIDKIAVYFLIGLIALIAVIMLPNMNRIKEFLGIDTVNSLRVELAKEIKNTEEVVKINDIKDETIKTHEESAVINIELTSKREVKIGKVAKSLNKIKTKVALIVVDDEKAYEEKSIAILDGLWESYCVTSEQCKQGV